MRAARCLACFGADVLKADEFFEGVATDLCKAETSQGEENRKNVEKVKIKR